jgi:hypothetical protein
MTRATIADSDRIEAASKDARECAFVPATTALSRFNFSDAVVNPDLKSSQ